MVAAIFVSACVAGAEAISRLVHPRTPTDLIVLAIANLLGFGLPVADPLIGLAITGVILKITWDSWHTVRGHGH